MDWATEVPRPRWPREFLAAWTDAYADWTQAYEASSMLATPEWWQGVTSEDVCAEPALGFSCGWEFCTRSRRDASCALRCTRAPKKRSEPPGCGSRRCRRRTRTLCGQWSTRSGSVIGR